MRLRLILLAPLLLGSGCPDPADWNEPLGPVEEARLDSDLVGEWSCRKPDEPKPYPLLIAPFDDHQYLVMFKEVKKGEDELMSLRAFATDAGGHPVMNLQIVSDEKPKWIYARFHRSGDQLRIDALRSSALEGVPPDTESLRQAIGDLYPNPSLWEPYYRCVTAKEQAAEK